MKRLLFVVLACCAFFTACGDDDSYDFLVKGESRPYDDDGFEDDDLTSSSAKSSSSYRSSSSYSSSSSKYEIIVEIQPPCKTEEADSCEYGKSVDERDGKTYKTVKIGEQVWMAENLDYHPEDGLFYDSLLKCVPDVDSVCVEYGALYTWTEAIDSAYVYETEGVECGIEITCDLPLPVRGICPKGWHLPTYDEFDILYTAMGKLYYVMQAKNFKSWRDAEDFYGFSAIPVGYGSSGKHSHIGTNLGFWASTGSMNSRADSWYVHSYESGHTTDAKDLGYSVRCVQD